ncbi:MAG: hypothetical protein HRU09_19650 [Oligoflexales bacterium]|nr:hypothetical protein [Oligoflexales bacterium]
MSIFMAACSSDESKDSSGPIRYSGSCLFKYEIPGIKHPACIQYTNVSISSETLEAECMQGNPDNNVSVGVWAAEPCNEASRTSVCTDAPYAGGTLSLTLYSAGFNHIIRNSCESGSGLFINGAGTYTEYVALEQ